MFCILPGASEGDYHVHGRWAAGEIDEYPTPKHVAEKLGIDPQFYLQRR